jgi:SAM-dependent methyltransferase
MDGDPQRLDSERRFHNARFGDREDPRNAISHWYLAVRDAFSRHEAMVRALAPGRDLLEIGSADGTFSVLESGLAGLPRRFVGIDVSEVAIDRAGTRAAHRGLTGARFEVRDAERTGLPAGSFDVVFGRGILHHLDLGRAYAEIARLLRPGGVGLFVEPMGHNPLLNRYRARTPELRTPDEHPLLESDLDAARSYFASVVATPYGLATLAAVPLRSTPAGGAAMRAAARLDRLLFRVPALRRNAWFTLIELKR